ncbi:unnamed protein product [Urochloa decumbens]|uniref:Uncharacterized protein n=1 Tax=Urochloa decumbens TaxID=240449 RepID=A0ABC8WJ14_9POAL
MDEEELQEADVLWPWPDTPRTSLEEEQSYLPAAAAAIPEYDAAAVEFSCEPFSGPPPASSGSSLTTTSSANWPDDWSSSSGGFFLSGGSSSAGPAGLGPLDAAEEFLEADVLWPDTPGDEAAAGFWWRCCCRRVEEATSAAAAADAACGEREGRRPLVLSSPIDIPMAARSAAARRRRPSPLPAVLARRRW